MDTYGYKDTQARCASCNRFMPWGRSNVVEKGDGFPFPSPVYVEYGLCVKCETKNPPARTDGPSGETAHELP